MSENTPSGKGDDDSLYAELQGALERMDTESIVIARGHVSEAADIVDGALAGSNADVADEIKGLIDDAEEHSLNAFLDLGTGKGEITLYLADLVAGPIVASPAGNSASSEKKAASGQASEEKGPAVEKPSVETTYTGRTHKNIEEEVAETWRKMQAGEEVDKDAVGSMPGNVGAALQHALDCGDIPKAESYLAILRQLEDRYDLASACYAIGTENSFKVLHEEMSADQKRRAKEYMRVMEEEPAKGLLGFLTKGLPDLMKSVIIECRNRGISADSWIDDYSINADEKWVRRWQYYQPISEDFTALSATPLGDQEGVEKLATDYLADETQEGHVVHKQLRKVINHIKDPGLKERLLRRYMAEEHSALYDLQGLYDHRSVGMHILGQPICTSELVDTFTASIDRILGDMVQTGEYSEMKAKIFKLEWQSYVAHTYRQVPAAETAKAVEDVIKEIENSDMPKDTYSSGIAIGDDIKQLLTKRSAVGGVAGTMVHLAKQCAIEGDFKSAAVYAAVADKYMHAGHGTKVCLYYVHRGEDLKHFKPDELEAMVSEVKARQIKLSEALASGDADTLAAGVQEAINGPKPDGYEDKNIDTYVVAALERLFATDPKRGMILARAAMDRLEGDEISGDYWEISRLLIENGDEREIAHAYNLIENAYNDKPSTKLSGRQWFLRAVKKRQQAKGN